MIYRPHNSECIEPAQLPEAYQSSLPSDSPFSTNSAVILKVSTPSLSVSEFDLDSHLAQIEARCIQQALHQTKGNVSQAARLLNLKRTTLIERLKRLRIDDKKMTSVSALKER